MTKLYLEYMDENGKFDNGIFTWAEYFEKFFNPNLKILKIKKYHI